MSSPGWKFCIEAVGPLARDTGGLTYQRHFLEQLDDATRARTVLLVSEPVPAELDVHGMEVRTLPAFTATGFGKMLAVQAVLPLQFRRLDVSAVFCSGSIAGALAGVGGAPGIVVHLQNAAPLQTEVEVGGSVRDLYRLWAVPSGLRRARRVITPSETVRRVVVDRYDLDPARVLTIPLAVDPDRFHPAVGQADPADGSTPYILFVSALWPYKNASALVQAFAQLVRDERIPHRLVLAGKDGGDGPRLRQLAAVAGVADRVLFAGHVNGSELEALYRHADLFVYPSLVESFGFPLLEAMSSGVPVVASDRWAIPEICGGAAILCAPTDIGRMARAMHDVLSSPQLRDELVAKGLARAAEFSWERTVRATLRVIEDVATGG